MRDKNITMARRHGFEHKQPSAMTEMLQKIIRDDPDNTVFAEITDKDGAGVGHDAHDRSWYLSFTDSQKNCLGFEQSLTLAEALLLHDRIPLEEYLDDDKGLHDLRDYLRAKGTDLATITPHYLKEFPDYDLDFKPPTDFEDTSRHNDACPSWTNPQAGLKLWADYREKGDREVSGAPRFVVTRVNEEGMDIQGEPVVASETPDQVLGFIMARHRQGHPEAANMPATDPRFPHVNGLMKKDIDERIAATFDPADDIDTAVAKLMDAYHITTGDGAGLHFSEFANSQGGRPGDLDWNATPEYERRTRLRDWLYHEAGMMGEWNGVDVDRLNQTLENEASLAATAARQPTPEKQADNVATRFFGTAGLEFWDTGGGCTAFGKNMDDGEAYVLVTDGVDEDLHPHNGTTRFVLGFYDEDKNQGGAMMNLETSGQDEWQYVVGSLNTLIERSIPDPDASLEKLAALAVPVNAEDESSTHQAVALERFLRAAEEAGLSLGDFEAETVDRTITEKIVVALGWLDIDKARLENELREIGQPEGFLTAFSVNTASLNILDPAASDADHQVSDVFAQAGYELAEESGGKTFFRRPLADGSYISIVDMNDGYHHPTDDTTEFWIKHHAAGHAYTTMADLPLDTSPSGNTMDVDCGDTDGWQLAVAAANTLAERAVPDPDASLEKLAALAVPLDYDNDWGTAHQIAAENRFADAVERAGADMEAFEEYADKATIEERVSFGLALLGRDPAEVAEKMRRIGHPAEFVDATIERMHIGATRSIVKRFSVGDDGRGKPANDVSPSSPEKDAYAQSYFQQAGLALQDTGGGCTALSRDLGDGHSYILLTDADDPTHHPTDRTTRFMIGIYDADRTGHADQNRELAVTASVVTGGQGDWQKVVGTMNTLAERCVVDENASLERIAALAIPFDHDDWGTRHQIAAENRFGDAVEKTGMDMEAFEDFAHRATLEERLSYGLARLGRDPLHVAHELRDLGQPEEFAAAALRAMHIEDLKPRLSGGVEAPDNAASPSPGRGRGLVGRTASRGHEAASRGSVAANDAEAAPARTPKGRNGGMEM